VADTRTPPPPAPHAAKPGAYPAIRYHKNGRTETVKSDAEAEALGADWADKPNDNTIRVARKASGAAKTDAQPGVYQPNITEPY